jgi:hypothetical protein
VREKFAFITSKALRQSDCCFRLSMGALPK